MLESVGETAGSEDYQPTALKVCIGRNVIFMRIELLGIILG